jgi:hypothetical protein
MMYLIYITAATCSCLGLLEGSQRELQELHDRLYSSDTIRNDTRRFLSVRQAITRCKSEIKRIQYDIAVLRSIELSGDSSGFISSLMATLTSLQQDVSTIYGKYLIAKNRIPV